MIRASATTVRIFSKEGVFLCEWPRATARSQWCTDPNHLPANYKEISEWNGTYFTQKAMTVGPNTGEMIRRILASRKLEVQTYRMCQGVLSFTKKYSKQALEETCRQALAIGKTTYTFVKTTIPVVAEELGSTGYNTAMSEDRNKGAFVICPRCQLTIEREYQSFCDRCGQALNWSGFSRALVIFPEIP